MISKLFEIRDRCTFIVVLATKLDPNSERDRYLLSRAGYGRNKEDQEKYIQLTYLSGGKGQSCCDIYDWEGGARTLPQAHLYIIEHFNELISGEVIDVEYILNETDAPKVSEFFI